MAKAQTSPFFTPATLAFLRALRENNRRDWFLAHKAEYEAQARAPALRFIEALAAPLAAISPQLVASPRPVGGSLFRIHRDTRFAHDKTPYKTHLGLSFYHAATRATPRADAGNAAMGRLDAPLCYLHIEPGASFIGGGIWHPQAPTLRAIRSYLVNNPASWKQATRSPAFRARFTLGGESLQRPPQGYDPAHELIEDLKRKDIVASAPLSDAQICAPDLLEQALAHYQALAPLLDWLCGALDLEF
ncbi:MAG TPA: DUF2461 domain-containing protein [Nevskiaceae bacterium]|nr:DUF2461 domain-containing protein [Nevskiaceae bacterium]